MTDTLMPKKYDLGTHGQTTIGHFVHNYERSIKNPKEDNPLGLPSIMGYIIPTWQRPLVWTQEQKIRLIESIWKGLPIGTCTYNRSDDNLAFDNLLIDGQQRMKAIEDYLKGEFPVFGYRWSEITPIDRRVFRWSRHFPCYITETDDEQYLKDYYNLMNFSGTAHTEDQRAK